MAKRNEITKFDDIIDSRDVIARIEELEEEQADLMGEYSHVEDMPEDERKAFLDWEADNGHDLDALRELADEGSASPDWIHGETLIRDSFFEDYAQELAEDCGMIPEGLSWPCTCIDWEQAARELQQDYMSVDFDGVTYWIRA